MYTILSEEVLFPFNDFLSIINQLHFIQYYMTKFGVIDK